MKRENQQLIYSPSDLVAFLQSPFITWMNRLQLDHPEMCPKKDEQDALLSFLAKKGLQHESDFLAQLKSKYRQVVSIDDKLPTELRIQATTDAMKSGAEIIFQGALEKDSFRGYADFLVRVDRPSFLGSFSYCPWDTKLSRSIKPYFLVQLCCYADLLQSIQGTIPHEICVVLGTGEVTSFNTFDYFDFYEAKRTEFLNQQQTFAPDRMPDPFMFNEHGDWTGYVNQLREQRDHLSKVANITKQQITKLNDAGIYTVNQLAESSQQSVRKLDDRIFEKLKQQAKIQKLSEAKGKTVFEITNNNTEGMGLSALPPKSKADLFWDLEGFPLEEGGLEYLWGCTYFDEQGDRRFWERWAHDHAQEKQAFIDFVEFAYARWKSNPDMHIFHYGHYELSVCQRLMGRYGVKEKEVDTLLRNRVFVDLYDIVRKGILLGEPSYSIKNVEHIYRSKRETDVASGGDSVAVYARWRDTPDGDIWEESEVLSNIRDYNIDDCNSTQELVDWLRQLQQTNDITYTPYEPVNNKANIVDEEPTDQDILAERLRKIAEDKSNNPENRRIAQMLADFVHFHKRENKPLWWRYFERLSMDYSQLYDDPDCLVSCVRTKKAPFKKNERARNWCFEYQYDTNQEFRNRRFENIHILAQNPIRAKVEEVDTINGLLVLNCKEEPMECFDAIVDEFISPGVIESSILEIGERYCDTGKLPKPLNEFLLRLPPDTEPSLLLEIDMSEGEDRLRKIIRAVGSLNNSYISIQGPPGTGKTYTGKHIIVDLLKKGKTVGITSNSHKAINNLLLGVAKLLEEENLSYPLTKIQTELDSAFDGTQVEHVKSNAKIEDCIYFGGSVVGATAWGFSRADAQVDYLFIDEAGQVSLANLVAMSAQAKNIVCLGDQMQLPQPLQGSHPGDSGMSILDYALQEHATVPPNMGIFLNKTFRMHQDVNRFISEGIYESRLGNDKACNNQEILLAESDSTLITKGSGIQYMEIEHTGNKQASQEEVSAIVELVETLSQSDWKDKSGSIQGLTPEDIMIVAPFNYQVNEISKAIDNKARVGTVDKFQGQEAPVVIVSMTASIASESARGADFLLSKNRINVAVSRAQALAIIVASSTLLSGAPTKLVDIERYNLFYKLRHFRKG